MKKKHTNRGFSFYEFKDENDVKCNLQQSSNAEKNCIWLGADKLDIQEFVAYRQPSAWMPRPEFDVHTIEHHFIGNNRMHLSQKQVKKLLPILTKFAETGEI